MRVSWRRFALAAALLAAMSPGSARRGRGHGGRTAVRPDARAEVPHRHGAARPLRARAGHGRPPRRGAAGRAVARRFLPRRGRAGPGLGGRLRPRLARLRRTSSTRCSRPDARGRRQPRHRTVGRAALPDAEPAAARLAALATACAKRLGPRRDFYGTADHAEDLDAVRAPLGYDSIALFGVSYGTSSCSPTRRPPRPRRALARLGLAPRGRQPVPHRLLAQLPKTLARSAPAARAAASRATSSATSRRSRTRWRRSPRAAQWCSRAGRHTAQLGGDSFPRSSSRPTSPGDRRAAAGGHPRRAHGDPGPLLRLWDIAEGGRAGMYPSVNLALFMATTCRDGPFPWTPNAARRTAGDRHRRARSPARRASGPFDHWASRTQRRGLRRLAEPEGRRGARQRAAARRPGARAQRRPRPAHAHGRRRAVVSRFREGHLLVAPGSGHSVLSNDVTGCAASAVDDWLAARPVRTRCPSQRPYLPPVAAYPDEAQRRRRLQSPRAR